MTYLTNLRTVAAAALVGSMGCGLIGCASNPPADAQIAVAKASIARADKLAPPKPLRRNSPPREINWLVLKRERRSSQRTNDEGIGRTGRR